MEVDTNSESEYDLVSEWGEPVPCDLYDNASTRSSEDSELEHESQGSTFFSNFKYLGTLPQNVDPFIVRVNLHPFHLVLSQA